MIGGNHQRDILIAMTQAIRKETVRQVYEKIRPTAWHPDSLTEITESAGSLSSDSLAPGEREILRHPDLGKVLTKRNCRSVHVHQSLKAS